MNTVHLGDAYDFMKKDILRVLKVGLKKSIYVLPMFTDEFKGEYLTFYKNLTSYEEETDDKIKEIVIKGENRRNYFNDPNLNDYIVFIDPNTGIKDSYGWNYIHYDEIEMVARNNNFLVIYDQSFDRRKDRKKEIESKLKSLKDKNLHAFYLNAQTSFAFISKNEELLNRAKCLLINQVALSCRLIPDDKNHVK
ncbi:MAG: hypothetical protein SNJ55_02210 [Chloroherpetonaceae bacterium]